MVLFYGIKHESRCSVQVQYHALLLGEIIVPTWVSTAVLVTTWFQIEENFPKLFSERYRAMSYKDCIFDTDKNKENCARAAVARECVLIHCFTLEGTNSWKYISVPSFDIWSAIHLTFTNLSSIPLRLWPCTWHKCTSKSHSLYYSWPGVYGYGCACGCVCVRVCVCVCVYVLCADSLPLSTYTHTRMHTIISLLSCSLGLSFVAWAWLGNVGKCVSCHAAGYAKRRPPT